MTVKKKIIFVLLILVIACSTLEKEEKPELFLLGLDGFNWHVAYPLVKQGLLPNVEKLMEKGVSSPFQSFIPTVSPILWTSIATGKTPDKHRIYWRVVSKSKNDPDTKFSMSSQERDCKAFWNILSDAKFTVDLINWWCSWPAEVINGYNVTFSYMQYDETDEGIYPPEFLEELDDQHFDIGIPSEMKPWLENAKMNLPAIDEDRLSFRWGQKGSYVDKPSDDEIMKLIQERYDVVKNVAVQDNKVRTISEYILNKNRNIDLFAAYFWYVDLMQHHYWKYMEPEYFDVDQKEMKVFNGAIPAYFMYMDSVLEGMINRISPNGHIIICSDHGMEPGQREKQISEHIDIAGIINKMKFVNDNPDVKIKIHDSIRTIRTFRLDFPETYDLDKKNDFKEKFTVELKKIKGLKKGEPLFDQVLIMGENDTKVSYEGRYLFLLDPADISIAINIYMGIDENIKLGEQDVPIKQFVPYAPQPSGNHPDAPDGFFLGYGPYFAQGYPDTKPTLLDITPTILYFFGLPVAEDMDGSPFMPLFKSEFKNKNPVKKIKTYEQGKRDKKNLKVKTRDHQNDMIDQLKSLGYIQ